MCAFLQEKCVQLDVPLSGGCLFTRVYGYEANRYDLRVWTVFGDGYSLVGWDGWSC